ncbi:MAG: 4-(cytidine 5'-diphospho)-2-C-methyl-D-erythritol kinase [Desulfotomaculales bacterium]
MIREAAQAKINLVLNVLSRRPDGYHEIASVMQTLALHDEVELTGEGTGVRLTCEGLPVPCDETNLARRAALLLAARFGIRRGVRIRLTKRIPVAAGLGGGSADAAAVLRGLNRLWGLGLSPEELAGLGAELGSDVPFCVFGGTALVGGRGERVVPLPPAPPVDVVLFKPPFGVATAEVYRGLERIPGPSGAVEAMLAALREGNPALVGRCLVNDLESVTLRWHLELALLKERLRGPGVYGALLAGSGPTVFALVADRAVAAEIGARLGRPGWTVVLTRLAGRLDPSGAAEGSGLLP